MDPVEGEPTFNRQVVAAIGAKQSVERIITRKFGPDYDHTPVLTMIGFAFFRQLVSHVVESVPEGMEAQVPVVLTALEEMGLQRVAERTDKRDRRFRHRRKMEAIEALRKDREIGVTSDAFIEFARSLVPQSTDDQELAALKKPPTMAPKKR